MNSRRNPYIISNLSQAELDRLAELKMQLMVMEYSDGPTDWAKRNEIHAELSDLYRRDTEQLEMFQ